MTLTAVSVQCERKRYVARRGIGRQPLYVDLESNPVVDAEHPADLKYLTEAAGSSVDNSSGGSNAVPAPSVSASQQNGLTVVPAKHSAAAGPPQPPKQNSPQATDVNAITETILSKVSRHSCHPSSLPL